ncbi:hypothetical protein GCM10023206_20190 [Acinetobacter puyangensis]|uniref:Tocopherol cyclase n=1 Tax=Acinetobacter puyangensis TaxID=1096779 RepID=A0A240EBZ0_9GAMM|nr:hypothetical protein [Acinetobacter puyangensis]SNX46202.1 hypothetical protein SAMN05421731_10930 [Acinetobacter puyangensis]
MKPLSKIVENPEVTLDIEGHGIPEDAKEAAFLDWLCSFVATGDDGKTYWFGCSPLSLAAEHRDMWHFELCWDTGQVRQSPHSIYQIAIFPPVNLTGQQVFPEGTLQIIRYTDEVHITVSEHFKVICKSDHTWHYSFSYPAQDFKAEFIHAGVGFPTWYGKEKPSYLTSHSIAYGYNWSGKVQGKFTIQGKEIHFKGKGIRERYIAVDSSAAEIGGWEDWGWFHFDEVFGSLYEMRLGNKDFSINLVEENQYYSTGTFKIEHQQWAYLPQLGAFIPTVYVVNIETEAGVLTFSAKVVGATVWGVTGHVPDNPVATLNWSEVAGQFKYKDGRVKALSNGAGGVSIRQWKPYPAIFGAELFGETASDNFAHFQTL